MSNVQVTNLAVKGPEGAEQPRQYWLGIKDPMTLKEEGLPECPYAVLHVGGMDFPLVTELVQKNKGENVTRRTQIFGAMRQLFPSEVARIKAAMKTKVIRGKRLLSTVSSHYRPQVGDIPIEKFLYIREVMAHEIVATRPIPPVPPEAVKSEELAQADDLDKTRRQMHQQLKVTGQKLPQ